MIKYLLFVLISLCILAPIKAGDCYIRPRSTYTSYAPTLYSYSHGSYKKYEATPSHSDQLYYYKDGYYYPYENVKEKIVLVPKAIEVEVQPHYAKRDHFYSVDPYLQQNLLADAIVGRLLRMKDYGAGGSGTGTSPVTVIPSNPILPSAPVPQPLPAPTVDNPEYGTPRAGAYQEAKTVAVVTNHCAKCHGPNSKDVKLMTADGKLNDISQGKAWECFGLVNSGEMPKATKSLDDNDVKLFYAWAKNARKK